VEEVSWRNKILIGWQAPELYLALASLEGRKGVDILSVWSSTL
jgi:hypothetical protein